MFSTLVTLVGAALIFLALRDVFHQLFRPTGAGSISGMLMRGVWRAFRPIARRYPSMLTLAGPAALVVIIAAWVSLVAAGWALVYWPRLPEQFLLAPGLKPSEQIGFVDALYFSLVTVTTLGFGNIAPTSDWLRLVSSLEGLLGFGLLTASLTWVVSIYPPLTRRRALAQQVALIRDAESESGVSVAGAGAQATERRLESLTSQLTTVRSDLSQFPITYYFHSGDERESLPAHMQALLRLAEECAGEDAPPPVRLGAAELRGAIDDFCSTVGPQFLGLPSTPAERVLAAYARDHLLASPKDGGRG